MHKRLYPIIILAVLSGCHSAKESVTDKNKPSETTLDLRTEIRNTPAINRPSAVVAMAHIYKTNGDYHDKVPVTLNARRDGLVSYPGPSDLIGCSPIRLKDGFLLDRRGINPSTAFTRWTYEEYSKLPSAPSTEEIMANIIPGATVTKIYRMPFTTGTPDAAERCDSLISEGLPGCKLVYTVPQLKNPE